MKPFFALILGVTTSALAHDGHGMPDPHWHATDLWGFALALAVAGVALWWNGRR